ncbi:hypothetical protein CNR22_05010 [Sphingobacteriaceae bacterium]|nr:hypothetical protein CNR22_05010 [Sphingobacteriaceae bacterium]
MSIIHNPSVNLILRSILKPFKKIIPSRFHFAINGKITVNMPEGKKMVCYANPTSPMLRVLFWGGVKGFEYDELAIFIALAKKSDCFFDIGANLAYYSIVAKLYNKKIVVHAFEPLPGTKKFAEINAAMNGFEDITLHSIALSNTDGEAVFHSRINPKFKDLDIHLNGDSSLYPGRLLDSELRSITVKTERLDTFFKQHLKSGQKIDLIKMDTEGTENMVLEGSADVLKNHRPIIMCEIITGGIEKEVQDIMLQYKYIFFAVESKGLRKTDTLFISTDKQNFFFVPTEKETMVSELLV